MPNWNHVLHEIQQESSVAPLDKVRRKYLDQLAARTGRNVIAYYSGWLSRAPNTPGLAIDDNDKNAFMTAVHGLDRALGLDLILHTPGGNVPATESLVDYLRQMFGNDVRAIVPQLAMSAGTMIACFCKTILMGKQSNLGPIDPQLGGVPAHGVISEFRQAIEEIRKDPASLPVWREIIGKYHPTFLGECQRAIDWSREIATEWLAENMLAGRPKKTQIAKKIVRRLSDYDKTRSHGRHVSIEECEEMGLAITRLEADNAVQDLVLTVHHAYMHTFSQTPAIKIVENQKGSAMILIAGNPPR